MDRAGRLTVAGGAIAALIAVLLLRRTADAPLGGRTPRALDRARRELARLIATEVDAATWDLRPAGDGYAAGSAGALRVARGIVARGSRAVVWSDLRRMLAVDERTAARIDGRPAGPGASFVVLPREI